MTLPEESDKKDEKISLCLGKNLYENNCPSGGVKIQDLPALHRIYFSAARATLLYPKVPIYLWDLSSSMKT